VEKAAIKNNEWKIPNSARITV